MSTGTNKIAAPTLTLKDVCIDFPTTTAFGRRSKELTDVVYNVDLEAFPGETVAIVGGSGFGKSITVHAALGLLPGDDEVTGGTIIFDGRDITHLTNCEFVGIRGSGVGLVLQDPMTNLNLVWTVGAQIKEAPRANNIVTDSEAYKKTTELLEQAGLPDAKKCIDQYPHEYPGDMRQRALIAMGPAAWPKLLIADELISALDVAVAKKILDHLGKLTSELGISVVLVTHDLGLAVERADRLVVMQAGRVVETGSALQVLTHPQHPYTKQLIAAAPSLIARRGDRVVAAPTTADRERKEILAAENLVYDFTIPGNRSWHKDTFRAVDDISFMLRRGHTISIMGESGSGKSTVANMVLGLLDPTEGEVFFDGKRVQGRSRKKELELQRRIQPIFQDPYATLDPMRTVYSPIEKPLRIHKIGAKKEREQRTFDLFDRVALPAKMGRRFPGEFSGGQHQRVAVARALALNPEVVVCDEVVSALDVVVQAQVLELLAELQEELDLAHLFITRDLAVVRQVADEVIVIEHGKMVEHRPTDELFDRPEKEYTQRLLDAIPGTSLGLNL